MTFLILGKSETLTTKDNYRGTYRPTKDNYCGTYRPSPSHVNEISDEHKINRLWRWYVDKEMGDGLSASDLIQAQELILEYKGFGQNFRIVELAAHKNLLTKGKFIGYDLSFKNYQSMLSWGLELSSSEVENSGKCPAIFKLVEQYFQFKLNECGLLDEYEDISWLFQILLELHHISPEFFESYLPEFKILAIGLLEI